MASSKRTIGFGGLIVIALILASIGGGLVGGVAGYRLGRGEQAIAPTTVPTITQPTSVAQTTPNVIVSDPNADAIVQTVKNTAPAVVKVVSTLGGGAEASGSGAIISQDGYIITNNHVVESQKRLQVIYSDGTVHEAELIGTDAFADVAVIRVRDAVPATINLGDSDALQAGETVIAIGSPLGKFQNSVTVGVISALDRTVGTMESLIQTDAAINHGNSGGPLINLKGEIVGINTLVVRGDQTSFDVAQGLGFAVPSNIVKEVSDALIQNGRVERPFIGIEYELISPEMTSDTARPDSGALVTRVIDGSPARRAGLLPGDVITAINSEKIDQRHSLMRLLSQYKPNDTVTLTVIRDSKEQTVSITLAEQ